MTEQSVGSTPNPLFELNDLSLKASRMIAQELDPNMGWRITEDASGMLCYEHHNGLDFETLFFGPAHLLPSFLLAPRA